MSLSTHCELGSARFVTATLWGFVCALIFLEPVLLSRSFHVLPAVIYLCFSGVCHQIPERSFFFLGHPLPVCHRCSGIYLGLFLGSMLQFSFLHKTPAARRWGVGIAVFPMLLDLFLPYLGLWHNTASSRFLSGFLFGTIGSSFLARGFSEFLQETSWRRLFSKCAQREVFHE
jgi:uncharacterized membrane protein